MNIFEGTHIKLDLKRYPRTVFFFKEDRCWMEYNWKNGYFGCRYEDFWEVLEREYHWGYDEVERFIKNQVEQHFKLKGITPCGVEGVILMVVEEHFKVKGITPYTNALGITDQVEQYFDI